MSVLIEPQAIWGCGRRGKTKQARKQAVFKKEILRKIHIVLKIFHKLGFICYTVLTMTSKTVEISPNTGSCTWCQMFYLTDLKLKINLVVIYSPFEDLTIKWINKKEKSETNENLYFTLNVKGNFSVTSIYNYNRIFYIDSLQVGIHIHKLIINLLTEILGVKKKNPYNRNDIVKHFLKGLPNILMWAFEIIWLLLPLSFQDGETFTNWENGSLFLEQHFFFCNTHSQANII